MEAAKAEKKRRSEKRRRQLAERGVNMPCDVCKKDAIFLPDEKRYGTYKKIDTKCRREYNTCGVTRLNPISTALQYSLCVPSSQVSNEEATQTTAM